MKRRESHARLRVAIGLLAGLVFITAGAIANAQELTPVQHVLPYSNAGTYDTTLVIVNATGEPLRGRVIENRVWPPLVEVVEPFSVSRTPAWPRRGVNVETVELDPRLVAYVEIRTASGQFARVSSLSAVNGAEFYNVPTSSEFTPALFVAVPPGQQGYFTVETEDSYLEASVSDETATILDIAGDRVIVAPGGRGPIWPPLPGPPAFYTFVVIWHNATGAIVIEPSTVDLVASF